nr:hypothetical protein CparaKRNrm2_p083 [Cryptomonas paramecium]
MISKDHLKYTLQFDVKWAAKFTKKIKEKIKKFFYSEAIVQNEKKMLDFYKNKNKLFIFIKKLEKTSILNLIYILNRIQKFKELYWAKKCKLFIPFLVKSLHFFDLIFLQIYDKLIVRYLSEINIKINFCIFFQLDFLIKSLKKTAIFFLNSNNLKMIRKYAYFYLPSIKLTLNNSY